MAAACTIALTMGAGGRSEERIDAAIAEIGRTTASDRIIPYLADLSSLAGVRRLAEQVAARHDNLAALVKNAGVGLRERAESEDGYELTFAVNYLAPYLLTRMLLPVLRGSGSAADSACDFYICPTAGSERASTSCAVMAMSRARQRVGRRTWFSNQSGRPRFPVPRLHGKPDAAWVQAWGRVRLHVENGVAAPTRVHTIPKGA